MDSAARFDDSAKEDVRSRIDIAAVIGRYVTLKQSGQTLKGLCPFHKEKTPSFHVNPSRGFFHCFGCGKGGDVFAFVQEVEGIGFGEALRKLADEVGVTLPSYTRDAGDADTADGSTAPVSISKTELQRVHELALHYYYDQIKQFPPAIEYFKTRGLKPETVREFHLGYAPAGWSGLISFCKSKGVAASVLTGCGLAIEKDDGNAYDRFRDRIMFPLCDISGKVIAFAGRSMSDDVQPKYLNSPETPLYHKNRFLYGLDKARTHIRDSGYLLIVEGYMDYLALYQAGIRNVVAASGTAFTEEHAHMISRLTSKVVLVFDGDSAGQTAAQRGVFLLAPFAFDVTVLVLPGEEDPDSFVKKFGAQAFLDQLKAAKSSISFIIEKMKTTFDWKTANGKTAIIGSLAPLVRSMKSAIARDEFRRELAENLHVDPKLIFKAIPEGRAPGVDRSLQSGVQSQDFFLNSLEGSFLWILVTSPDLIDLAGQYIKPETITDRLSADIYSILIEVFRDKGSLETILERTTDPEVKRVIASMLVKPALQENIHDELVQKIFHLRRKYLRARIRDIKIQMKKEPQQRLELLQQIKDCSTQLQELD